MLPNTLAFFSNPEFSNTKFHFLSTVIESFRIAMYKSSRVDTSEGSPHNLLKYKSVSETTIAGGNDSAPRGFVVT